jgi:hypothetical protein
MRPAKAVLLTSLLPSAGTWHLGAAGGERLTVEEEEASEAA